MSFSRHLVSEHEQIKRNREAKRIGGLEVDDKFESGDAPRAIQRRPLTALKQSAPGHCPPGRKKPPENQGRNYTRPEASG
jgi:hypothetical protein